MLFPTDESRGTLKKYEEMGSKIRHLFRLITNSSDDYDEKCMKIKIDSHDGFYL